MATTTKGKVSQPAARHSAFHDSDDDDDNDAARSTHRSSGRQEEIVSFGRNGAQKRTSSPPRPTAPRVIPVASNLDWRQDRKQRMGIATNLKSLGPLVSMRRADSSVVSGPSQTHDNDNAADAINTDAQKSGLEIRQPRTQQTASSNPDSRPVPADSEALPAPAPHASVQGTDEEALKALLAGENGSAEAGTHLIIPQEDEAEFLQHDIESRPEAPSLDDYAALPIEQFGMALLRGMGWKEGMGAGKGGKGPQQAAEPKKRAALLGLGAKERAVPATGLPSSSSSHKHRSSGKRDYKYVPITRADSPATSNTDPPSRHSSRDGDKPRSHASSHRDERRTDTSDRHAAPRDSTRHTDSHSSRRRSRSPTARRQDRHQTNARAEDDIARRSHAASSSVREHRRDRDRDDRHRHDKHRDERHRDRRR
ncbi:g-patch domain protein [Moesziomyces antarcticus]|uniref:Related to Pre-mRNA-splicing factor SPP2 n=2 Tax=Pseudozyma antarctica TaxID=84753 RepID=A0A5C3FM40_PSEA2|nr:g-patch domain protein [Moesziomyces antarcticus]GAK68125.1 g-patch domain protein [Moesziomyces antarcticus]SPO45266.1 related to Pre-mRNA-splicing factor SPP2 [Moesziomyces antarcticus]